MKTVEFLKKHWYLFLLIIIVVMAFMIRAAPARYGELQALDPFYLYRISEYVVTHNFQMPEIDMLRNHPYGDTQFDLLVVHYFPPILYVLLNPIMQTTFFNFALIYPAIMGALSVFIMFFVGKELFNDKKAGLFAAFFLATVQAFITRTSAGFFEKEPTSSIFMFLSVLFFIKAFKQGDWRYGILSGVMLGLMTLSWGGSQYMYILYAIFALIMALMNHNIRAVAFSYIPAAIFGILVPVFIQPRIVNIFSTTTMLSLGVLIIILLRVLIQKFRVVKTDQLKFVTPSLMVVGAVVFLIGSMFIDFMYNILYGLISMLTLDPTKKTTVAESVGGDWNVIVSQTGLGPALGSLGPIVSFAALFSLWTFSVLGVLVLLYKIYKNRDWVALIPILWLFLAAFGVFFAIRLIYFMGPTVALLSGFLLAWLLNKSRDVSFLPDVKRTWQIYGIVGGIMAFLAIFYGVTNILVGTIFVIPAIVLFILAYLINSTSKEKSVFKRIHEAIVGSQEKILTITAIPVILIVLFSLSFYTVSGYNYGQMLGPSINQYWYEAMDHLRYETPENSSVLSWWDFGYWFQTKGNRPTIADGGGVGNTSRFDLATWFTANSWNWTDYEPWLVEQIDVDYILMDYTLPGKYGAITKIASRETTVIGIMQLQQSGTFPQDNSTIFEFRNGPYVVWVPIIEGAITSSPMFLVDQGGGQYTSQSYVNDVCTEQGMIQMGDKQPSLGGCLAVTSHGVYYIPEEAKNTIFTNLMFMDGYGLPLEKVFDNTLIKIYKVLPSSSIQTSGIEVVESL